MILCISAGTIYSMAQVWLAGVVNTQIPTHVGVTIDWGPEPALFGHSPVASFLCWVHTAYNCRCDSRTRMYCIMKVKSMLAHTSNYVMSKSLYYPSA
ncbi:uncharacterized protein B0H18DRAFT_979515, partial [Fomitopsis serialis]|uniref:uncharacterized protein n=1 Tax=Fomitopsis serialis TaxID=139415 RepID=UPI002008C1CF